MRWVTNRPTSAVATAAAIAAQASERVRAWR